MKEFFFFSFFLAPHSIKSNIHFSPALSFPFPHFLLLFLICSLQMTILQSISSYLIGMARYIRWFPATLCKALPFSQRSKAESSAELKSILNRATLIERKEERWLKSRRKTMATRAKHLLDINIRKRME